MFFTYCVANSILVQIIDRENGLILIVSEMIIIARI